MNDLPLYQIVDWTDYFENAKSRTYDKCQYVVSPNKHGGSGWSNVMGELDGAAIWGIWNLLKDLCSRQRKPREGWLTADGKKNGRRLSARELANQFRRPIEEIHRCLMVLQSHEVAFIRLVDGQPEHTTRIPDGYQTDTAVSSEGHPTDSENPLAGGIPDGYRTDTAVSLEYPQPVSARNTESKKVTKKESTVLSPSEGQQTDTGRIPDGYRTDTGVSTEATDLIQHAEAKLLFGNLAKEHWGRVLRPTQWPHDLEHFLDKALPMPRARWQRLEWFYRLPEDDVVFKHTMRRQSFNALIENIQSEDDKIIDVRRKLGLNGLFGNDQQEEQNGDGGWTAARKQAAFEEFGESITLPDEFRKLPGEYQRKIEARVAKELGIT